MSLEKLQKIRERRMEKQFKEVMAHKSAVLAAENQLIQAHQQLTQFRQWRLNHQEELFRELLGQSSSPQAMVEYRTKLEVLVGQEEQLRAAISPAEEQIKQAITLLERAQTEANKLAMKNEKTKEIVKALDKEDRLLSQAKEHADAE